VFAKSLHSPKISDPSSYAISHQERIVSDKLVQHRSRC